MLINHIKKEKELNISQLNVNSEDLEQVKLTFLSRNSELNSIKKNLINSKKIYKCQNCGANIELDGSVAYIYNFGDYRFIISQDAKFGGQRDTCGVEKELFIHFSLIINICNAFYWMR